MEQLLNKFRIPVSDVVVIADVTTPPSEDTKAWFDSMINNLVRLDNDPTVNNTIGKIFNSLILIRSFNLNFPNSQCSSSF